MILRDLLKEVSYKSVFNFVYKTFLKDKEFSYSEIMSLDMEYYNLFMSLQNSPAADPGDNKIYITHLHDIIDVCLLDEKKDEIFALDSISFNDIIDMEIYKAISLDNIATAGFIIKAIKSTKSKT